VFNDLAEDNHIEFPIQGIAHGIRTHDVVSAALQFFDLFPKNVDPQHGFCALNQAPVHPKLGTFLGECMCHTTNVKHILIFHQ
jgi:hypothetical protein